MPAVLRLFGVALVALVAACALDSAPVAESDTLGRWSDAIPALAPLVAEARGSIAESGARGTTIRARAAIPRVADGSRGMRARSVTRALDAFVETSGAFVLREDGRTLFHVERGRGAVRAERGTAVAEDVAAETDAVLFARSSGIEDLLRLKSSAANVQYDVALPVGWTLFQPEGAPWLVEARDAFGIARARLKAERGWDAAGGAFDVALAIDASRIHVRPLTNGPYPVVVDPLWQATGTMVLARDYPATTLLPNGRVLIVGAEKTGLAETFDPQTGTFTATNNTTKAMMWSPFAIPLAKDGTVLVGGGRTEDGSSYTYDPSTNMFTSTGTMHDARAFGSAVQLSSGNVLVTGGGRESPLFPDIPDPLASTADIYDPVVRQFRALEHTMVAARAAHTSLVLPSGSVLIVGGMGMVGDSTAELFDPVTETFADESVLTSHAFAHVLPLANGRVLVFGDGDGLGDPEVYDPATHSTRVPNATLHDARTRTSAAALLSGHALFCGGDGIGALTTCSDYDPILDESVPGPTLLEPRWMHGTLTRLPSGGILVAGGSDGVESLSVAEILEPAPAEVDALGSLCAPRAGGTVTQLASGVLLLAGGRTQGAFNANRDWVLDSAEVLDPMTLRSRQVGRMGRRRYAHTASLLPSGKVAIIGGTNDDSAFNLATAESYDPADEIFRPIFGPMSVGRAGHSASVLASGEVLVTGGRSTGTTAEVLGDQHFTVVGSMGRRREHTDTLLPSGKVLVVGSELDPAPIFADLFDPQTSSFSRAVPITQRRGGHTATSLASGDVLVAGGLVRTARVASAERYSARDGVFKQVGDLRFARSNHASTLLSSGDVLISGGVSDTEPISRAEVYRTADGVFETVDSARLPRTIHRAVVRADGKVLLIGGYDDRANAHAAIELFDPAADQFVPRTTPLSPRHGALVAALPTGEVMIAGGRVDLAAAGSTSTAVATALVEIHRVEDGATRAAEPLRQARFGHSLTVVHGAKLFIAGGTSGASTLASTELYETNADASPDAPRLLEARAWHSATLLPSGNVLVSGGIDGDREVASIEELDFRTNTSRLVGTLRAPRHGHASVLLDSGLVAIVGGLHGADPVSVVEIYDPGADTVTTAGAALAGAPTVAAVPGGLLVGDSASSLRRYDVLGQTSLPMHASLSGVVGAVQLPGGLVGLIAQRASTTFDEATGDLALAIDGNVTELVAAATTLASGDAFVLSNDPKSLLLHTERWSLIPSRTPRPFITQWPGEVRVGALLPIRGTGFSRPASAGYGSDAPVSPAIVPTVAFRPANGGPPVFATIVEWSDDAISARLPATVYRGPGYLHVIVQGVPSLGKLITLIGTPNGMMCRFDAECVSGFCTDGVCCSGRCGQPCEACAANLQEPARLQDGECLAARAGTNPKKRCIDQGAFTCGQTGRCDGKQTACGRYPDGIACANGGHCEDGACVSPTIVSPHCDPSGNNLVGDLRKAPVPCAPFRCDVDHCRNTCGSNLDCVTDHYCDLGGHCVAVPSDVGDVVPIGCSCSSRSAREDGKPAVAVVVALLLIAGRRHRTSRVAV